MYAGKLNTYEIKLFSTIFFYTSMYWYSVMDLSKIEIYKGKHNEVHKPQYVSRMNALQYE